MSYYSNNFKFFVNGEVQFKIIIPLAIMMKILLQLATARDVSNKTVGCSVRHCHSDIVDKDL